MEMQAVTEAVRVLSYGKWNEVFGAGEPVFRKDGTEPEFVAVADAAGELQRFSLSQSVNGDRPPELTECKLEGTWRFREGYGDRKPAWKFQVTGFKLVKA